MLENDWPGGFKEINGGVFRISQGVEIPVIIDFS
jgi:hypothetical protein